MKLSSYDFRGLINRRFFDNLFPMPARCQFELNQLIPAVVATEVRSQDSRQGNSQGSSQSSHQSSSSTNIEDSLSAYRGKPLVLAFTRIFTEKQYCPFCYPHILALNEAYSQFVGLGAQVLMITSTDLQQSQQVKKDLTLKMPLLSDPSCQSFRTYGTGQALGAPLPAQFVVDAEGKLRFQHLFSFAHHNASPERLLWAIRNL